MRITIRLEEELFSKLVDFAQNQKMTRAALIRKWIEQKTNNVN